MDPGGHAVLGLGHSHCPALCHCAQSMAPSPSQPQTAPCDMWNVLEGAWSVGRTFDRIEVGIFRNLVGFLHTRHVAAQLCTHFSGPHLPTHPGMLSSTGLGVRPPTQEVFGRMGKRKPSHRRGQPVLTTEDTGPTLLLAEIQCATLAASRRVGLFGLRVQSTVSQPQGTAHGRGAWRKRAAHGMVARRLTGREAREEDSSFWLTSPVTPPARPTP